MCHATNFLFCADWLSKERQTRVLELLTNAEISILKKKDDIRQYTPSYQIPGVSSLGRRQSESHHNVGIDVCASDDSSASTQGDDLYLYSSSVGLLDDDSSA